MRTPGGSAFAAWVPAGGPSIRRSGPIVSELFLYFHVLDYYCWNADLLAGGLIMEHGGWSTRYILLECI